MPVLNVVNNIQQHTDPHNVEKKEKKSKNEFSVPHPLTG